MKIFYIFILSILLCPLSYAEEIIISPSNVGRTKQMIIRIQFERNDSIIHKEVNPANFTLNTTNGEKVPCAQVVLLKKAIRCIFQINAGNFVVFEKLIKDSIGYYISNDESVDFSEGMIEPGGLEELTKDKIHRIDEESWKKYILDEYSSHYLFPHLIKVGLPLSLQDSMRTTYFIELIQSSQWGNFGDWSMFWGIQGRWSTFRGDKLNYAQVYPLVLFHNNPLARAAMLLGVETGYRGYGEEGRGLVRCEVEMRVPYNPIDLTFGKPRWRINPIITLGVQGNFGWARTVLPDSMKHSVEIKCGIRYDIPIGNIYYLQSNVDGYYSNITKDIMYRYAFALGYIFDGSVRIMAEYKQGFQNVTYQFDRQLLLGFAIDVLNESIR